MRRPRVALIWYEAHDEGGAERGVAEIVRGLCDRYELVVFASELQDDLVDLVEWRRVRAPKRPFVARFVIFALRVGLQLRRERFDLRHAIGATVPNRVDVITFHFHHGEYMQALGSAVPAGVGGVRRASRLITRLSGLALERWACRPSRVRALAAVSERQARWLRHRYPGIPVHVTPNGADGGARTVPREEARRELGIPADAMVAVFVGSDFGRKGLADTIDALARVNRGRDEPLHLIVVGDGDLPRYAAQARRTGVGHAVHLVGVQPEPDRFYAAADVFVLPTTYETFCIAAYEAARHALPIVGTPVNGIEELVSGGDAGILVEPSPESVAAALERLAGDPEARREMGRRGKAIADGFTWKASVASVDELYATLLRDR